MQNSLVRVRAVLEHEMDLLTGVVDENDLPRTEDGKKLIIS